MSMSAILFHDAEASIILCLKKLNPDIRVLITSGLEKNGNVDEILNDGQNGFIQKPFKFDELTNNIDRMLSLKKRFRTASGLDDSS